MRIGQAAIGVVVATAVLFVAVAQASASPPTLGVRGNHPTSFGFGQVRPSTVNYGGDPTSFVSNVKWSSWGGGRAVGHGRALWVWPGWCVACGGVELPATVVAYGRTTCQGHSAYRYVEWFFPSRGQSFDRRLHGQDLCTWAFPTVGSGKLQKCGQVALQPGVVAANIETFESPLGCSATRQFVAASGAGRYLGRNARFTVDGWWCGSQLSMAFGGLPQTVTCDRGNRANVTFALKRG